MSAPRIGAAHVATVKGPAGAGAALIDGAGDALTDAPLQRDATRRAQLGAAHADATSADREYELARNDSPRRLV